MISLLQTSCHDWREIDDRVLCATSARLLYFDERYLLSLRISLGSASAKSNRSTVACFASKSLVPAKSDLIDKLGVVLFSSIPFGYLLSALLTAFFASFRNRAALQLEILALRHPLGVLQRSVIRPKLTPRGSIAMQKQYVQPASVGLFGSLRLLFMGRQNGQWVLATLAEPV